MLNKRGRVVARSTAAPQLDKILAIFSGRTIANFLPALQLSLPFRGRQFRPPP